MASKELIRECYPFVKDLKSYCVESMFTRKYSWKAKYPSKVMCFVNAMNWRMYETADAAFSLMKKDKIVPALSLVRCCWENMAVTYELKVMIEQCCEKNQLTDAVDEELMRTLLSNRYEKDNRYVGEEHYENMKEFRAKNILTLVRKIERDYPQTKDLYSTLCEFVHPNGDGVCGSYSHLDENSQTIYFGPQFNRESDLFPTFVTILSCALMLYLKFIDSIESHINTFARLCEISLDNTMV